MANNPKRQIIPQFELLTQLAAAVRPSWNADEIRATIAGAQTLGWSWQRILASLQVLMNDPDAKPTSLLPRRPTRTDQPADPDLARRHAALAREQWPNLAARREPNPPAR